MPFLYQIAANSSFRKNRIYRNQYKWQSDNDELANIDNKKPYRAIHIYG